MGSRGDQGQATATTTSCLSPAMVESQDTASYTAVTLCALTLMFLHSTRARLRAIWMSGTLLTRCLSCLVWIFVVSSWALLVVASTSPCVSRPGMPHQHSTGRALRTSGSLLDTSTSTTVSSRRSTVTSGSRSRVTSGAGPLTHTCSDRRS